MKEVDAIMISELSHSMEIDLHERLSMEELKLILADHVNYLITHDLNKLMRILYRVDVSEKTLKTNLQDEEKDPATIIADMILERQLQKIQTKKQTGSNNDIPENEKW